MNFQSDHTSNTIISFLPQSNAKIKITYSIPVVDPDNDHAGIVKLQKANTNIYQRFYLGETWHKRTGTKVKSCKRTTSTCSF
jgi:hypothetical protein